MTESKLVWLAIGIFVGFVLWGEGRRPSHWMTQPTAAPEPSPTPDMALQSDSDNGLTMPWTSCGCGSA